MARVTQSAGGDFEQPEWSDDRWYPVFLNEVREILPKGSIGYKGQPRKNAEAKLVWATDDDLQSWIFDGASLTPSMNNKGQPSRCLAIMCALTGRDPYKAEGAWIDNETLEFGFEQPGGEDNAANWPVAGRIQNGVKLAIRGELSPPSDNGRVFLRPEKYRQRTDGGTDGVQAAAASVANVAADMVVSEDGQWVWNGSEWIPNPSAA